MKKVCILFLLISSAIYTSSQEYSKAYLDSLPEDIRKDVEERMDATSDFEEPSYRLSDTPSELAKREEIDLDLFGSEFFNTIQTSFMPINVPNLDDSYILDYGDVLSIQLIGQEDSIDSFQLGRDGSIKLDDIGQINLAGLSLYEASNKIKAIVNKTYIGTEAFISLVSIRDVSVMIAGDAYNPGVYTLNGASNMLHALHAAGGIGKHGSYRSIKLIRNQKVIETLDVYDILINGKFSNNNRLRSGDIIFVDPRFNVVTVEGAFKRPFKYELTNDQSLSDAIKYAGGISIDADLNNIFLYRILDAQVQSLPIMNISQFDNINSIDLDRVYIRRNSFRNIEIAGAVLRPGSYKLVEGQTIFDLIEAAGGYTINAFPEGAIYLNEEAKEINRKAADKLYEAFIDGLLGVIQQNNTETSFSALTTIAKDLKDIEPNGRIIIDLFDDSNPYYVKNNDYVFIPEKTNNVYIFGEVFNEGSVVHDNGGDLDYYLAEASGLKESGNPESIYILYPNGRTKQFKRKRNIFVSQSENVKIIPGSIIYVPRKIDNSYSSLIAAQAYATILGNIGLSLASLNSINKWLAMHLKFFYIYFLLKIKLEIKKVKKFFLLLILAFPISADSFKYNSYNNHGVVGLVNMPTARFYDEAVYGITIYDGEPDQKITLTSNPFDWMEASFFYTNLQNKRYCNVSYDPVCRQDYKDKGFNLKLRIKGEGKYPAFAVGFNDIAGTGLYSSEYIVASQGFQNIDIHYGLSWGTLNVENNSIKNPFRYISNKFIERPTDFGKGGQFEPSRYFSGAKASPFFGISYSFNDNFLVKFERDNTSNTGRINYQTASSNYSIGIDYLINDNLSIGLSHERGAYSSLKFVYKNNPKEDIKKYTYKKSKNNTGNNKYEKFINNLEENGIGVNKILETSSSIGVELTQFMHPNLGLIEEIIYSAAKDSGINKNIKKDLKIADLTAVKEINKEYIKNSNLIYERQKTKSFNSNTGIKFRPFLASREEFFKGAILVENDSEYIIKDNLLFNANLKYSLIDNFDDLIYPPVNTFPAQVRSDIKDYLRNMSENGLLIGRAQLDYYLTPQNNNHIMISAGILEDMFMGYGFEYIYFEPNSNYAYGFELFSVKKRDYEWKFGLLDFQNTVGSINFYYRNYGLIPFDMKLSHGEYLAGDFGTTIDFSRTFSNGTQFGVFASFTDVSTEQFGEGSFDKGIYFNIPIYGSFINYSWRPLTKDPGAKINRRNTLYDLLVKFRPLN